MAESTASCVVIRPYQASDREALLDLAIRLTEGIAPWRDQDAFHAAARRWINDSIERPVNDGALFVAADDANQPLGFVSVNLQQHFTGETQANIGELVVARETEGHGIGRQLVTAAEQWAAGHDCRLVTLLTGAANRPARAFYHRLGFQEEEIRLTKLIE